MQSHKYFPVTRVPFFHMKAQNAAVLWMAKHNLSHVVHVRRGDKVLDGSPVAPLAHYERILKNLHYPRVAVCTDDPQWVREQSIFKNAVVSENHDPGFDMALLAAATDAVIIGVGTFGWWGAYLSNAKRVYYRKQQYQKSLMPGYNEIDYIPSKHAAVWIGLD